MADAEIARFHDILRQIDELQNEFAKIKRIGEIVKGFRARVEALDRRVWWLRHHVSINSKSHRHLIISVVGWLFKNGKSKERTTTPQNTTLYIPPRSWTTFHQIFEALETGQGRFTIQGVASRSRESTGCSRITMGKKNGSPHGTKYTPCSLLVRCFLFDIVWFGYWEDTIIGRKSVSDEYIV